MAISLETIVNQPACMVDLQRTGLFIVTSKNSHVKEGDVATHAATSVEISWHYNQNSHATSIEWSTCRPPDVSMRVVLSTSREIAVFFVMVLSQNWLLTRMENFDQDPGR
jgi:hypothetical protein